MYLKQLYNHSKFWFLIIALFIVIQLSLDVRRDASISPFYHYGMYSQVIKPQKIYVVPEITVNGKPLQTKNFSPQQWDNIIQPVVLFDKQENWNLEIYTQHIHPLLHVTNIDKYINHISAYSFQNWYKKYLQIILQQKINSLSINYSITAWSKQKLHCTH